MLAACLTSTAGAQNLRQWLTPGSYPGSSVLGVALDTSSDLVTAIDSEGPTLTVRQWSGANNTWSFVGAGGPSTRYDFGVASDPTGGVVLFGGGTGGVATNETWRFRRGTWTQLNPASSPSARIYPMMARLRDGNVVLFGGEQGGTALNDTWEWDGTDWTHVPTPGPSGRYWGAFGSDGGSELVLFGGTTWPAETWTYRNATWTLETPLVSPPALFYATLVGYPDSPLVHNRHEAVMFGGFDGVNPHTDTWTWADGNWTQRSPSPSFQLSSVSGIWGWPQAAFDPIHREIVSVDYFDPTLQQNYGRFGFQQYGMGCPQAQPVELVWSTTSPAPKLGQSVVLEAYNVTPNQSAIFYQGPTPILEGNGTPLGSPFGPNCLQFVNPSSPTTVTANAAGVATYTSPTIPIQSSMIGRNYYYQVIDPNAWNASNGLEVRIGR